MHQLLRLVAWLAVLFFGVQTIEASASATVSFDFEAAEAGSRLPSVSSVTKATPSKSVVEISKDKWKDGHSSLKWIWSAGDGGSGEILRWNMTRFKNIRARETRMGGMEFHIYNTRALDGKCLKICIKQEEETIKKKGCTIPAGTKTYTSCFHMSLNYKGWRAVWVSYAEFRGCPEKSAMPTVQCISNDKSHIKEFSIEAPPEYTGKPIYLDHVQFVGAMTHEARDVIVPPIMKANSGMCVTCAEFPKITESDAVQRHDQTKVWNQALRWDIREKKGPSPLPLPLPPFEAQKLDLLVIKKRFLDWYSNSELDWDSAGPDDSLLKHRWNSLLQIARPSSCPKRSGNILCAHILFKALAINKVTLSGPGLYCRNTKATEGIMHFQHVFHRVLHPLALQYHILSDVEKRACALAKKYDGCAIAGRTDLKEYYQMLLTGGDKDGARNLNIVFDKAFGSKPKAPSEVMSSYCPGQKKDCVDRFKRAITKVNRRILEKVVLVFRFLRDQGFAEGSSLGSLGHQMLVGSGYMHAAFLTLDAIRAIGRNRLADQIITTMRWFLDFGEIYQKEFEFFGTTADRMRVYTIFRVTTVLSMPEDTASQVQQKINEMKLVSRWIDNALKPNEGRAGFLKPDYTTFHHSFYYGGAYSPHSLETASLLAFLLDGTEFKLSDETASGLYKALRLLKTVAVKYSTPSSIGGRYPDYHKQVVAKVLMTYVYIAINSPNLKPGTSQLEPITLKDDKRLVSMLKALFPGKGITCPTFNKKLCGGQVGSITYLNSLGCAQMLKKIEESLSSFKSSLPSERALAGHWVKNYAALSIHRRHEWAVTVKGFNKFVLDPERYPGENEYGFYGMNGAILIANNEDALMTKDVNKGWKWCLIPGTTAIDMTDPEIKQIKGSRRPNRRELAGGVTFRGNHELANGAFGMDYALPHYELPESHVLSGQTFVFKKSVFFLKDVLVVLGSDITSSAANEVTTSLFQDLSIKKVSSKTSSPSEWFYCNEGATGETKDDFSGTAKLVDRHGNKYFIPPGTSEHVVVTRQVKQKSTPNYKKSDNPSGTYCTAWIEHGIKPKRNDYMYFVQVSAVPSPHDSMKDDKANEINLSDYVVNKDSKAHSVFWKKHDVCGYVVFDSTAEFDSSCPVKSVDTSCVMMSEESGGQVIISVAYPQMNLKRNPPPKSVQDLDERFCSEEIPANPEKGSDGGTTYLYCAKDQGKDITITIQSHIKLSGAVDWARLDGEERVEAPRAGEYADVNVEGGKVTFKNLKHGKSLEVGLPVVRDTRDEDW